MQRDAAEAAAVRALLASLPTRVQPRQRRAPVPAARVSAIRAARLACTRAAGYVRSRAIRATVLRRSVAGQIADLLGLVDREDPATPTSAERERARAVGFRLRLGAGTEVHAALARTLVSACQSAVRLRESHTRPCGVPCPVRIGSVVVCVDDVA